MMASIWGVLKYTIGVSSGEKLLGGKNLHIFSSKKRVGSSNLRFYTC